VAAQNRFFEDDGFEFQALVALGSTAFRMAEVGEVMATVSRVKDRDSQSWFDAWMATADRVETVGDEADSTGRGQTARDAYLRAANYIGTGFFNILGTSHAGEKVDVWKRHRAAAEKAFERWPTPVEKVAIPYEDTALEGFFFSGGEGRRPLVIFNNGSDGTVVEMLTFGLGEAVDRGYHALTFDGPGQGQALYIQGLFFRHDWEHVITPVIDWSLERADVDPDRIALFGCSQAGYWVPRAAAFEHRLAAAMVDPGVLRVGTSWTKHFPDELMELFRAGDRESFDGAIAAAPSDPALAAMAAKRMEPYGTDSMFEILSELERWDLTDVAKQIECPILITDPEGEQFWPGQSRQLYDLVEAPKTLISFTAAEGANWHCEPMAPVLRTHRLLDWIDETLGGS
jgi:hypothetical protein